jgi:hypothetical protein
MDQIKSELGRIYQVIEKPQLLPRTRKSSLQQGSLMPDETRKVLGEAEIP